MLQGWKARLAIFGAASVLLLLFLSQSSGQTQGFLHHIASTATSNLPTTFPTKHGELPLPDVYQAYSFIAEEPGLCAERYGTQYIRNFSRSATSMCESDAPASMTCFAHQTWDKGLDEFCFGTNASIDPETQSVALDCPLLSFTKEEQVGHALPIDKIEGTWYATGPRYIFDKYIHMRGDVQPITASEGADRFALLVKREGGNVIGNAWHVFMQMMSLWLSIDVLRTTVDPVTGKPYYTDDDVKNTQVIVLDEEEKGPFYELWDMFGDLPTVQVKKSPPLANSKIVVPISGGTNPLWLSRTQLLPCSESVLLRSFVHRILDFYKIAPIARKRPTVTLTYVDRHRYRALVDKTKLLDALKKLLLAKYPHVKLQIVDFARFKFRDQVEMMRTTDILVGVHGAGLTHTMFLPEGGTVVEIQPPGLKFFGFETLARFLGHGYFQQYGYEKEYEGMKHNWQADDVFITEEKFLGVIEYAINVREWKEDYKERRLGYAKKR